MKKITCDAAVCSGTLKLTYMPYLHAFIIVRYAIQRSDYLVATLDGAYDERRAYPMHLGSRGLLQWAVGLQQKLRCRLFVLK